MSALIVHVSLSFPRVATNPFTSRHAGPALCPAWRPPPNLALHTPLPGRDSEMPKEMNGTSDKHPWRLRFSESPTLHSGTPGDEPLGGGLLAGGLRGGGLAGGGLGGGRLAGGPDGGGLLLRSCRCTVTRTDCSASSPPSEAVTVTVAAPAETGVSETDVPDMTAVTMPGSPESAEYVSWSPSGSLKWGATSMLRAGPASASVSAGMSRPAKGGRFAGGVIVISGTGGSLAVDVAVIPGAGKAGGVTVDPVADEPPPPQAESPSAAAMTAGTVHSLALSRTRCVDFCCGSIESVLPRLAWSFCAPTFGAGNVARPRATTCPPRLRAVLDRNAERSARRAPR